MPIRERSGEDEEVLVETDRGLEEEDLYPELVPLPTFDFLGKLLNDHVLEI